MGSPEWQNQRDQLLGITLRVCLMWSSFHSYCIHGVNLHADTLTHVYFVGLYGCPRPGIDGTWQENTLLLASSFKRIPNVGLRVSNWQASSESRQCQSHLKFDQANFNASWVFWSSSSSRPLIHLINFFISLSVSFSKVLHCAMLMLTVVYLSAWCYITGSRLNWLYVREVAS